MLDRILQGFLLTEETQEISCGSIFEMFSD